MIVLITNATSELGAKVAKKFADNNHQVIATGRSSEGLDRFAAELGLNVMPVVLEDATCRSSIREALGALPEDWKSIDILVNNATLSRGNEPAHKSLLADWEAMIDVNCKGLVAMTREVLPGMLARGTGTILNLSSAPENQPSRGSNVYGATVAFVHQYTLSLLESLVKTGVRATCIAPKLKGGSELPTVSRTDDEFRVSRQQEVAIVPTAADIADTTYWIATLPAHVDINHMELAHTGELFSSLTIKPNLSAATDDFPSQPS